MINSNFRFRAEKMSSQMITVCQICWNMTSHKTNPTLTTIDKIKKDKTTEKQVGNFFKLFATWNFRCWHPSHYKYVLSSV